MFKGGKEMKKVTVNDAACISCGACMDIAKGIFKFGTSGRSEVIKELVPDDNKEVVMAADSCPTGAIIVEDVSDEEASGVCEDCGCKECKCDSCEAEDCECEHCECDK